MSLELHPIYKLKYHSSYKDEDSFPGGVTLYTIPDDLQVEVFDDAAIVAGDSPASDFPGKYRGKVLRIVQGSKD